MARRSTDPQLSRRERQIMDIIYARGRATAMQVRDAMTDAPSYSAVRGLLRVLEEKGHLRHRREGVRNVYMPTYPRRRAGKQAMKRALQTYYDGNLREAVAALLDVSNEDLTNEQVEQIERLVEQARQQGA